MDQLKAYSAQVVNVPAGNGATIKTALGTIHIGPLDTDRRGRRMIPVMLRPEYDTDPAARPVVANDEGFLELLNPRASAPTKKRSKP